MPRNVSIGTSALTTSASSSARVVRRQPDRPDDAHEQVRDQDHHQDGEEHDRVDDPGAAEQQRHVDDRLGLDQHEAGAEEEHLHAEARAAVAGRPLAAPAGRAASSSAAMIAMTAPPRRLTPGIIGSRR